VTEPRAVRLPTSGDLAAADDAIAAELAATPLVDAPELEASVALKLETLQPTGSFKVRGGLIALARAAAEGAPVIAASNGNHGLGVASGATRFGVPATVVVPENASAKKVQALEQFDITLLRHGHSYEEAEHHALELSASDPDLRFVSPYNDPDTIAGQSTIAFELVRQLPDLSMVVVPVGGGGLIAGVALGLIAADRPDVRVVGVAPAASPAMLRAFERGRMEPAAIEPTLADGLAGNLEAGTITVDIARAHVETMVAVSEAEIAAAIRHLAFEHGVVSEGAGAVGVAALQAGRVRPHGARTVILVTGRNIAAATLAAVLRG
jgi:threonine dehydratase